MIRLVWTAFCQMFVENVCFKYWAQSYILHCYDKNDRYANCRTNTTITPSRRLDSLFIFLSTYDPQVTSQVSQPTPQAMLEYRQVHEVRATSLRWQMTGGRNRDSELRVAIAGHRLVLTVHSDLQQWLVLK